MACVKKSVSLNVLFPIRTICRNKVNLTDSRVICLNRYCAPYIPNLRFVSTGDRVQQEALEKKIKTETKKKSIVTIKRPPFITDTFLGKYNKDVLIFPEVLEKEQLVSMDELYFNVKNFFKDNVNSQQIDSNKSIPEDVLQGLKDLGLFGQQIPMQYGGLDLSWTEHARLGEIIGQDWSIQATLAAHGSLATQVILKVGTEDQKTKYLPKLATGEYVAAVCFTELSGGSDASSIQTTASMDKNRTHYLLNGVKTWVTNGLIADIFIVFAMAPDIEEKEYSNLTAFIVSKASSGVQVTEKQDCFGVCGANICSIKFDDTPVPLSDVLGKVGSGYEVLKSMHSVGRFFFGPAACGLLKGLLDQIVDHSVERVQYDKPIIQHGLIEEKIGKMASITYAIESMVYVTAGLLDTGEDPDCSVETAILRVFSTEGLWWCLNECLQIMGGMGLSRDHPFTRHLRDTRSMMLFEGTNEIVRQFISLMGCSSYSQHYMEDIKKIRNSLMYPWFTIKKKLKHDRVLRNKAKLEMDLAGHLHPTLTPVADFLEHDIIKLEYSTQKSMSRCGADVYKEGADLGRLADIAIDIYAMTSCLARASRSHCIGLRNSDHELHLAFAFCQNAHQRIDKNWQDIENAPFFTNDATYSEITGRMMKFRGYAAEHPLKRNY